MNLYIEVEISTYPELRLVIVMHEDNLSYAETFEEVLQGLLDTSKIATPEKTLLNSLTLQPLVVKASEAFENYLIDLGAKEFEKVSSALRNLQKTLEESSKKTKTQ